MKMRKDEIHAMRYGGMRKNVSVSFAENFHTTLKTRAVAQGKSVSAYLEGCMIDVMDREIEIENRVKESLLIEDRKNPKVRLTSEVLKAVKGFPHDIDQEVIVNESVLLGINGVAKKVKDQIQGVQTKTKKLSRKREPKLDTNPYTSQDLVTRPELSEAELFA